MYRTGRAWVTAGCSRIDFPRFGFLSITFFIRDIQGPPDGVPCLHLISKREKYVEAPGRRFFMGDCLMNMEKPSLLLSFYWDGVVADITF